MDNNFYSIADQEYVEVLSKVFDATESPNIDDVFKISHSKHILVKDCLIKGNQKENAIDMNRECENIEIIDTVLISGKQNALTIKGGCTEIIIENVSIVPGTGNCDIELGGWSDQSLKRVTKVKLINVTRMDGKPVRLRVVNADYPEIVGGNIEYMWFASLLAKTYWKCKKIFGK